MSPELVRAHFGGVVLSLPWVFILGTIAFTDSLEINVVIFGVFIIEFFATLPWSVIAAVIFFLESDLAWQGISSYFAFFLIVAILIPGAYFNGFQFSRYVAGLLKSKGETRGQGRKPK